MVKFRVESEQNIVTSKTAFLIHLTDNLSLNT